MILKMKITISPVCISSNDIIFKICLFFLFVKYLDKNSISSQYKESSTQNTNIESQRNRKELQKRINIARKTLQNVY